ncbi:MAG: 30S ribosomal protein S9 [Dehalococcoidia bacterium]|nr:MAG: 30S ribosomal protein S9 [Dehalococcoidia bacterium]
MTEQAYFRGTGKRKTAVAQVRLMAGNGAIIVNGKPFEDIFSIPRLQSVILEPLVVTESKDKFNAVIKVEGGGISAQAGAIRHGISRALLVTDENLKPLLRSHGLLTRDARIKERKKYGLRRARKARQYRKR